MDATSRFPSPISSGLVMAGNDGLFEQVAERRRLDQRVDRLIEAARNARNVDSLFGADAEDARADAKDNHAQPPAPKLSAWERVQQGLNSATTRARCGST